VPTVLLPGAGRTKVPAAVRQKGLLRSVLLDVEIKKIKPLKPGHQRYIRPIPRANTPA